MIFYFICGMHVVSLRAKIQVFPEQESSCVAISSTIVTNLAIIPK